MFHRFTIIDTIIPDRDWTEYAFILIDDVVYLDSVLHHFRKTRRHVDRIIEGWNRIPTSGHKYRILETPKVPGYIVLKAREALSNLKFVV